RMRLQLQARVCGLAQEGVLVVRDVDGPLGPTRAKARLGLAEVEGVALGVGARRVRARVLRDDSTPGVAELCKQGVVSRMGTLGRLHDLLHGDDIAVAFDDSTGDVDVLV